MIRKLTTRMTSRIGTVHASLASRNRPIGQGLRTLPDLRGPSLCVASGEQVGERGDVGRVVEPLDGGHDLAMPLRAERGRDEALDLERELGIAERVLGRTLAERDSTLEAAAVLQV